MKILVPTDFSAQSKAALAQAVDWAAMVKGTVLLLHVAATTYWPRLDEPDAFDPDLQDFGDELQEASREELRVLQAAEIGSRVPSEVHVVCGTPHVEIQRFAAEQGVDLLVIATHGHSRLKRFLLGSTTERIVRSAPCSVLVVRNPGAAAGTAARSLTALGKILVGTDFSVHSAAALERSVELAKQTNAEILLVHVLREADQPARMVLSRGLWAQLQRRSQRWLEFMQSDRIGAGVRSSVVLTEGVPSAKIADIAADTSTDLVVLGSHGRSKIGDLALGSTAERVVRVAPCSVYVHKHKRADRAAHPAV